MRRRRRRALRRRAAAAVLAAATALQRLADRVAGTAAAEVPRPPHLADAPEHWLRMVAAYAPGLLRPPGAAAATEPAPAMPAPRPTRQPSLASTPPAEQRSDRPRRRHETPADARTAPGRAHLAWRSQEHATTVPAAVPAARGASEAKVGAAPARPAAAPEVPTAERSRRTALPRVRPAELAANVPDATSPDGATPTWAATLRPPQPAPPQPPPVRLAPYPVLPPRASMSTSRSGGTAAPREPGSPRSHAAAARFQTAAEQPRPSEHAVPATSHWPELPPAAPTGTARLQRRLADWRADLARIQEVG
ncbi:hypothetical protein [Pseudactinotalea terrae]|uniref:hypothetical protein n=1 Tax=Pseudactinotalea terrae TaxID=1743262 RepID=UPI0012E25D21|nr:hypothetical protein [Pseudactinotalea terrae]